MKTEIISVNNPTALQIALQILEDGGLIAFPTDTVYGLAAGIKNIKGIDRLYDAKLRDLTKAIPILVSSLDQMNQVSQDLPHSATQLAGKLWPGALTLIVPIRPGLPGNISPTSTIGVRMPDHPFALALLNYTGPLATTSANLSGGANTTTADEVAQQLSGRIELILDGGKTPGGVPSTVVDCTITPPRILRQGAISSETIQAILG
jgi:L-threonylcarbamoyladenylate synthase